MGQYVTMWRKDLVVGNTKSLSLVFVVTLWKFVGESYRKRIVEQNMGAPGGQSGLLESPNTPNYEIFIFSICFTNSQLTNLIPNNSILKDKFFFIVSHDSNYRTI